MLPDPNSMEEAIGVDGGGARVVIGGDDDDGRETSDYFGDADDDDNYGNDDDADVCSFQFSVSKNEAKFMKEHKTMDLPEGLFKSFQTTKKGIKKLMFVGFELRAKYPHNIALTKEGDIIYCTDFVEDEQGRVEIKYNRFSQVRLRLY